MNYSNFEIVKNFEEKVYSNGPEHRTRNKTLLHDVTYDKYYLVSTVFNQYKSFVLCDETYVFECDEMGNITNYFEVLGVKPRAHSFVVDNIIKYGLNKKTGEIVNMENRNFVVTVITTDMFTGDVSGDLKELNDYSWTDALSCFVSITNKLKESYLNHFSKIRIEISLLFKNTKDSIITETFYSDNINKKNISLD